MNKEELKDLTEEFNNNLKLQNNALKELFRFINLVFTILTVIAILIMFILIFYVVSNTYNKPYKNEIDIDKNNSTIVQNNNLYESEININNKIEGDG